MHNYTQSDQQIHWLSQIIAKANRTYVPKKADDSHTNLYFDPLGNRIAGRWISMNDGDIIFTLNLDNQTFEIIDRTQKIVASIPIISFRISEVERKIESLLSNFGLNPKGFSANLHFEIPNYEFTEEPIQIINPKSINEWKHYRQIANEACSLLLGHAQVWEEIRIWPHHFDTGIYATVKKGLGLGFGLAMEDAMVNAPYFYMSGYPDNGSINYNNLPEGKEWKWELREHWNGAILPLFHLEDKTATEQMHILSNYIFETFNWFIKQ
jgi:hypothetical protein